MYAKMPEVYIFTAVNIFKVLKIYMKEDAVNGKYLQKSEEKIRKDFIHMYHGYNDMCNFSDNYFLFLQRCGERGV